MLEQSINQVQAAKEAVGTTAAITRLVEAHREELLRMAQQGQEEIQRAIGQIQAAFGSVESTSKNESLAVLQQASDKLGDLIGNIAEAGLDEIQGYLANIEDRLGEYISRLYS